MRFHIQLRQRDDDVPALTEKILREIMSVAIGWDHECVPESARTKRISEWSDSQLFQADESHKKKYGSGFFLQRAKPFVKELTLNAIGLVRCGITPVALVEIVGNLEHRIDHDHDPQPLAVTRYDLDVWYPVKILGWYREDAPKLGLHFGTLPGPGTFQILKNRDTATYKAIEQWLDKLRASRPE